MKKILSSFRRSYKLNLGCVYSVTSFRIIEKRKHLTTQIEYFRDEYWRHSRYKIIYGVTLVGVSCGVLAVLVSENPKKKWCTTALADSHEKIYTREEVALHKTRDTRVWVTFGDKVYDITDFVDQHPGGDKIMMAAGGPVEPFWSLYAVHKDNEEVMKLLRLYEIGKLDPTSTQEQAMDVGSDPFRNDPQRHPALKVVSKKPFNAETPLELLSDSFITPTPLFFVRNHLPVPEIDVKKYSLTVSGIGVPHGPVSLKLPQLPPPVTTLVASVMCAGNRRSDMNQHKPVRGLAWGAGAISTAEWRGVLLTDFLTSIGVPDLDTLMRAGARHVQFEGLDEDTAGGGRYGASVPIEVALDPRSQLMLAREMNGEPLTLDHGFPVRLVVPGAIGARQVKWLSKIIISDEESTSFWQQNDYKTFSPSTDPVKLNYSAEMAILEPNVQSAICMPRHGQKLVNEGSITMRGYAWSGGGRGILRVEISVDGGQTWQKADLIQSEEGPLLGTPYRGQWAWTLWEAEVPISESCQRVELLCKAVDASQNSQPDTSKGGWNVRGLLSNSWHRIVVELYSSD